MRVPLLLIALGLLATSSGQETAHEILTKYMCEVQNICPADSCTCVKKHLCRNSTTDSDEGDNYGEDQINLR